MTRMTSINEQIPCVVVVVVCSGLTSLSIIFQSYHELSAYFYCVALRLPYLNQLQGNNGRTNDSMTSFHERMLSDPRIEPATVRSPFSCKGLSGEARMQTRNFS